MPLSTEVMTALLKHLLDQASYTNPTAFYCALSTADPLVDGSGMAEPSGNNYARVQITFATVVAGATSNSAQIQFPTASGSWGTQTHFAIFDAATDGTFLGSGPLGTPRTVVSGNAPDFAVGTLTIPVCA
jgi:hypothetical protein